MNSEELELSLRTEFESYLKTVLGEIRQEAADFQSRMEGEFDRQKQQFDEAFRGFSARFDSERRFDEAFSGSVSEHLRLARDEGARITADAMAEAEKLAEPAVAPAARYDSLRDAVSDISTKDSQSAILKSLVTHAAEFAARGAFFIIKSEHFAGWKVFGAGDGAESAIREVHFPVSNDTVLAAAANSLATADGSRSGDDAFTGPLQFDSSDSSVAVPLVARGRSVAVLFADGELNREALEMLVRVAGLTVELLAANQTAVAEDRAVGAADFEDTRHDEEVQQHEQEPATEPAPPAWAEPQSFEESAPSSFEESAPETSASPFGDQPSPFDSYEQPAETSAAEETGFGYQTTQDTGFDFQKTQSFESSPFAAPEPEPQSTEGAMRFDSGGSIEPAVASSSPFSAAAEEFQPAPPVVGGFEPQPEPVVQASPSQGRLSDRPVDLPIEVPEDERRIHNDARRFARLLVSEIKLYNEKKVIEGRESHDLYDRLREAIDRSREMYDKRVQPPVAAKFDYFHYEIINALAEGDPERLGAGYPGSRV